ncbi:amidohydrolase family protein [Haloactinomyces albus]|uniref:TIM-barrel fold metal-dependent hydrolase n=1 Tax=Haloactinomyces albus TaxID=1352928 RepID=A0AAE3ZDP0_9ACTN|nr:amidohydrolase family protein [Haloactinomyces albus]MDR7301980.1 putative TIM-barrel fold metal-dependent hydrolase [Haloactinomyces albus]
MDRKPVFDFHARLAPRPGAYEKMLAAMDSAGIGRAVISSGGVVDLDTLAKQIMVGGHVRGDADNDAVLAAGTRSGGRLVPFFFANPHRDPQYYRERAPEFRGLELSPAVHGVPLTDERTVALVEIAAEVGHSVYVVCLGAPGFTAGDLAVLAEKFPDVTFVLGHCGFVGVDLYSLNRITPRSNVFTEISGCYTEVARAAVDRLGAGRVLFGTEYPLQHPDVELAKVRALQLDPESLHEVIRGNAHRILGEES